MNARERTQTNERIQVVFFHHGSVKHIGQVYNQRRILQGGHFPEGHRDNVTVAPMQPSHRKKNIGLSSSVKPAPPCPSAPHGAETAERGSKPLRVVPKYKNSIWRGCLERHLQKFARENDYKRMRGFEHLFLDHARVKHFQEILQHPNPSPTLPSPNTSYLGRLISQPSSSIQVSKRTLSTTHPVWSAPRRRRCSGWVLDPQRGCFAKAPAAYGFLAGTVAAGVRCTG